MCKVYQGRPPSSESVAMAQAHAAAAFRYQIWFEDRSADASTRGHAFPYGLPYPGAGLSHIGWPPPLPPTTSPGAGPGGPPVGHPGMPPLHHLPPLLPAGAHHPHNPFAQHHPQQDMKNVQQPEKKEPHVKKPLNAFMIYMKVAIVYSLLRVKLWHKLINVIFRSRDQLFRLSAHSRNQQPSTKSWAGGESSLFKRYSSDKS